MSSKLSLVIHGIDLIYRFPNYLIKYAHLLQ